MEVMPVTVNNNEDHDQPSTTSSSSDEFASPLLVTPTPKSPKTNDTSMIITHTQQQPSTSRSAAAAVAVAAAGRIESSLMFVAAIGTTLGWTAVLSNLVYYTITLGKDSYVLLNLAIYVPLLPIAWFQALWDSYYDRQYRSNLAFSARGAIGYCLTIAAVLLVPFASHNLLALSCLTLILGTASAIVSGTLKQMASFIYDCGTLPASVNAGMQAPAVLVLVVSLATGFGSSGESQGLVAFYGLTAIFVAISWASYYYIMSHSRDVLHSMRRRDSSLLGLLLDERLLRPNHEEQDNNNVPLLLLDDNDVGGNDDDEQQQQQQQQHFRDDSSSTQVEVELSFQELWRTTWPNCMALMLTVASSMSVSSWFNRVESVDPNNLSLPRVLFYVRMFADLIGRPTTLLVKPRSIYRIGFLAIIRLSFVPLFFLYTSSSSSSSSSSSLVDDDDETKTKTTTILPRSDVAVIAGVALFAFSSGYIATASYQLAPGMLVDQTASASASVSASASASATKQARLINVCFSAAVLFGILVTLVLQSSGL